MVTITLCEADDPRESHENGAIFRCSEQFVSVTSHNAVAIVWVYEAFLFCNAPVQYM